MPTTTPPIDMPPDVVARLARLEGIVEQMNQRLTSLESRLSNLETRVDNGFRWVIGIQVTSLLALGTLILFRMN